MSQAPDFSTAHTDITRQLATYACGLTLDRVSEKARIVGKHALLDWLGVTLAGGQEPLVSILRDQAKAVAEALPSTPWCFMSFARQATIS